MTTVRAHPSIAAFLVALFPAPLCAGDVTLEWDPVADERVSSYEVHYGLSPGTYIQYVAVPVAKTTATVSKLAEGRWYFAARACDAGSNCSGWSNEVEAEVATAAIPVPQNLRVVP
jgi:hypothetical protein